MLIVDDRTATVICRTIKGPFLYRTVTVICRTIKAPFLYRTVTVICRTIKAPFLYRTVTVICVEQNNKGDIPLSYRDCDMCRTEQ
jgi:hypothetical protein